MKAFFILLLAFFFLFPCIGEGSEDGDLIPEYGIEDILKAKAEAPKMAPQKSYFIPYGFCLWMLVEPVSGAFFLIPVADIYAGAVERGIFKILSPCLIYMAMDLFYNVPFYADGLVYGLLFLDLVMFPLYVTAYNYSRQYEYISAIVGDPQVMRKRVTLPAFVRVSLDLLGACFIIYSQNGDIHPGYVSFAPVPEFWLGLALVIGPWLYDAIHAYLSVKNYGCKEINGNTPARSREKVEIRKGRGGINARDVVPFFYPVLAVGKDRVMAGIGVCF